MSEARTSATHPIRVDFAPPPALPQRLGMTLAPGKIQPDGASGSWKRDLDEDLRRLRTFYKTDVLVCLLEDRELKALGLNRLEQATTAAGMRLIRFPIADFSIPSSLDETRDLVRRVREELDQGRVVVSHCMGGLGRTGMITACVLVGLGATSADAIAGVRKVREHTVETRQQEAFVDSFAEEWPE